MNEFAHGGPNDDHRGFTRGGETEPDRANRRIPSERGDGGKVEGLPEAPGANLREARPPAERAGLDEAGDQAGEGGRLSRTGVALIKEFGDQDRGGGFANAGNGGEQVPLRAEAGCRSR